MHSTAISQVPQWDGLYLWTRLIIFILTIHFTLIATALEVYDQREIVVKLHLLFVQSREQNTEQFGLFEARLREPKCLSRVYSRTRDDACL